MNSFTPFNHSPYSGTSTEDRGDAGRRPPFDRVVRVVTSESLFRGTHEIGIEHEGSMYRLKITRQGKLILNK